MTHGETLKVITMHDQQQSIFYFIECMCSSTSFRT